MASTLPQLLKAIQGGSVPEVKRVLTYNPSLVHQRQSKDGATPLHVAASTGNLAVVKELLGSGAKCQDTDNNMEVPLHIACRQRNGAAVVKELLSDAGRRCCLKAMNRDGATPLHAAVQAGLLDITQLLINAGAKVDAADRTGRTPLDYVDPRLPGLTEVLEAGRQLTPQRAPKGPQHSHTGGSSGSSRAQQHPLGTPPRLSPARTPAAAAAVSGVGGNTTPDGRSSVQPVKNLAGQQQQPVRKVFATPKRSSSSSSSSKGTPSAHVRKQSRESVSSPTGPPKPQLGSQAVNSTEPQQQQQQQLQPELPSPVGSSSSRQQQKTAGLQKEAEETVALADLQGGSVTSASGPVEPQVEQLVAQAAALDSPQAAAPAAAAIAPAAAAAAAVTPAPFAAAVAPAAAAVAAAASPGGTASSSSSLTNPMAHGSSWHERYSASAATDAATDAANDAATADTAVSALKVQQVAAAETAADTAALQQQQQQADVLLVATEQPHQDHEQHQQQEQQQQLQQQEEKEEEESEGKEVVLQVQGGSGDWSSSGGGVRDSSGSVRPAAAAEAAVLTANTAPGDSEAAAAEAAAVADAAAANVANSQLVPQAQQQQEEEKKQQPVQQGEVTAEATAQQAAATQDASIASTHAATGAAAVATAEPQQQHEQDNSTAAEAAAAVAESQACNSQGPLQQSAPAPPGRHHHSLAVPAALATVSGPPAGAAPAYCKGPLALAQPQMQPSNAAAAAGLAGLARQHSYSSSGGGSYPVGHVAGHNSSSSNGGGLGGGGISSSSSSTRGQHNSAALSVPAAIGLHYQQLAAATTACHHSLTQLQGNLSCQLSSQHSSSSVTRAAGAPGGGLNPAGSSGGGLNPVYNSSSGHYNNNSSNSMPGLPLMGAGTGASTFGPLRSGRAAAAAVVAGSSSGGGGVCDAGIAPAAGSSSTGYVAAESSAAAAAEGAACMPRQAFGAGAFTTYHGLQELQQQQEEQGPAMAAAAAAAAPRVIAANAAAVAVGPAAQHAATPPSYTQALPKAPYGATWQQGLRGNTPAASTAAALVAERSQGALSVLSLQQEQQQRQQQQQLAGIAAAVSVGSYGSSVGPLQAPLQVQLSDVSCRVSEVASKVSRLEEFMEAQLELIPDWQRALGVVTTLKRQADDHSHLLSQQATQLDNHLELLLDLSGKVDGTQTWLTAAQEQQQSTGQQLTQLEQGTVDLKEGLSGLDSRLLQLTEQLAQQAAAEGTRAAAGEAQVSRLVAQLGDATAKQAVAAARLSSVEAAVADGRKQLQEQQQAVAAVRAVAAAAEASGSSSQQQQQMLLDAFAQQLSGLQGQVTELAGAVTSLSHSNSRLATNFADQQHDRDAMLVEHTSVNRRLACGEPGGVPVVAVVPEGNKQQQVVSAELEETWLPFMESTSACLASHEQQIEALQALVPKIEGVVSQRASLINLTEQVAALQTALVMMGSSHRPHSSGGPTASAGPLQAPLAAHKSAAETLSLATSMVKLQGQMGQLTLAVDALQGEWREAHATFGAEVEGIRHEWQQERALMADTDAELTRLLAEQQAEQSAREERLMEVRAAASEAEGAARVAAVEAQHRLAAQLAALQEQQALMAGQLADAASSNRDLREELSAVKSQLAAAAAPTTTQVPSEHKGGPLVHTQQPPQVLSSSNVLGASYWDTATDSRRCSGSSGHSGGPGSNSNNSNNPVDHHTDSNTAARLDYAAAALPVPQQVAAAAAKAVSAPAAAAATEGQHQQGYVPVRRMTYDASEPSSQRDTGTHLHAGSWGAAGAGPAGAVAAAAAGAATAGDKKHRGKLGLFAKVGFGHRGVSSSSGSKGSKTRAGTAVSGAADTAAAADAGVVRDTASAAAAGAGMSEVMAGKGGFAQRRSKKAQQKQQQTKLLSAGSGITATPAGAAAAGTASHQSLFGRWGKQARQSSAGGAAAAGAMLSSDDWPVMDSATTTAAGAGASVMTDTAGHRYTAATLRGVSDAGAKAAAAGPSRVAVDIKGQPHSWRRLFGGSRAGSVAS